MKPKVLIIVLAVLIVLPEYASKQKQRDRIEGWPDAGHCQKAGVTAFTVLI